MPLITILSLVLTLTLNSPFASAQETQVSEPLAQDVKAIRAHAGCFEVSFNFYETIDLDLTSDITSAPYTERGTELVVVDEDSEGHIGLQHVLVTGTDAMKHWRQTWDYQANSILEFQGAVVPLDGTSNLFWIAKPLAMEAAKGQWRQTVSQVDDGPRFECSAPWIHVNGKSYWECTAPAPLPRREFSKRADYDILQRRNRQELMSWGWMHEQDNLKVLSQPRTPRALEKGYDSYVRVADEKCAVAKTKWENEKYFWKNVRTAWSEIRNENPRLELRKKANGTIYDYLFEMGEQPQSNSVTVEKIKEVIAPFVVKPTR